jgi:RimJ/RimL family protein N-acetyltransferase
METAGLLFLHSHGGIGEIEMAVDAASRGAGVGSSPHGGAVEWAAGNRGHKLAGQLWPHNTAARRLYQRFGLVEEGRLRRHYRRRTGELGDAVVMGLVLDSASPPGSSL